MTLAQTYKSESELALEDTAAMVMEVFGDDQGNLNGEVDSIFHPIGDADLERIVSAAVDDAISFVSDEISPRRMKAQRYFKGHVDIGQENGRSSIVATKCRDVVRGVKPSIQRIFMSSARPVEFTPSGPEDVESMEQASTYAAAKFRQNNGFKILRDVTQDALVNITGFTKAYWLDYDNPKVYRFSDLDEGQYAAIIESDGVELLSVYPKPDQDAITAMQEQVDAAVAMAEDAEASGKLVDKAQIPVMPDVLPQLYDIRIIRRSHGGKLCIDTVPPEDFFIDRNARDEEDFYVIGHRTEMRVADVIAMGIDENIVMGLDVWSGFDSRYQEDGMRRGYSTERYLDSGHSDLSMKKVTITEAYMRVDVDGIGTPILHKFLLGGSSNKLLAYEPVDDHPFAGWHVDPEPHTFFGRSLVEIVEKDQDTATAVIRSILDNVMMTNNPRIEAVRGQVEMDDLLNNEIGAVVRVNSTGMIRDLSVPFVAGQTIPMLAYVDQMVEAKTGVTRASLGLNPDSLQSTTRAAVVATVSAAAGQVEVMVANLAHTGMRRLFRQILRLMSKHSTKAEMMRINGTYTSMDPRVWDMDLDATINVGLGTGREEEKAAALAQVLQIQMQTITTYGPNNPIAGVTQMRNTLADILAISGLHNADRYFMPQATSQAVPTGAEEPQQPDPSQALVAAEQVRADAKLQSDAQRVQLEFLKAKMQDDRERDRMTQDLEIAMAEISAKYGIAIDTARIKAEQAATSIPTYSGEQQ